MSKYDKYDKREQEAGNKKLYVISSLLIIAPILGTYIIVRPTSLYWDYYLHYIDNANDPFFDWFVILMGGTSVSDITLLLVITLLAAYTFASFDKDEMRHVNFKGKHLAYGVLSSAVVIRLVFDCLFMVNNYYCDNFKPYATTIKKVNSTSVNVVIDSISFSKRINNADIEKTNVGDTIHLQVGKGIMGYYAIGDEYSIKFSGKKNLKPKQSKAQNKTRKYTEKENAEHIEKLNKVIADDKNEDEIYSGIERIISQHKDITGLVSFSFRVSGATSKQVSDIVVINNPKRAISQTLCDFIEQAEQFKRLDNGVYLYKTNVNKGIIYSKEIKAIKTKEDYENLLFVHLLEVMPNVKELRGSAFIDITINADNTLAKVVVAQSLNPRVDKIALECAKRIPWTANMDDGEAREKHFRLTIMYAKGKLWQVKIWSMD